MKLRILLLVCLLFVAASFIVHVIGTWGLTPCPVDLRPEISEKLKLGMTEKDVEAVLGGPAGNYTTRPDVFYVHLSSGVVSRAVEQHDYLTKRQWYTDKYGILVYFDPDGKAVLIDCMSGHPLSPPPPSTRYPPPLREIMHLFVDP